MVTDSQKKLGELKTLLENKNKAELTIKSIKEAYHNLSHFTMDQDFYYSLYRIEAHMEEELNRINSKLFEVESEIFNLLE